MMHLVLVSLSTENHDVIDWPLALSTASQALRLVGELRAVDKQLSEADLKMTLTDARTESTEKDAEIERLKKLHRRVQDETIELYGYR
jgi:hypothetical protein